MCGAVLDVGFVMLGPSYDTGLLLSCTYSLLPIRHK